MSRIAKMRALLDRSQRRNVFYVIALMLVMGLIDLAGVASILPFLAVLSNPDVVQTQPILARIYDTLGFTSTGSFLRFLGLCVFIVVLSSIAVRAATFYVVTRFTRRTILNLVTALLTHYLSQPYEWFLGRHSADLTKSLLAEASQVVSGSIGPTMRLAANGIVCLMLLVLLVSLRPVITVIVAATMGGIFGVIYFAVRQQLLRIGADRVEAMNERYQLTQEALTGIKEVKLLGLEGSYADRFDNPSRRLARYQATISLVGEMPRYALEAVTYGGVLVFILWVLWAGDGRIEAVLPVVGAFAFAGLKLMPAMQSIFRDVAQIRFGTAALDRIHEELDLTRAGPSKVDIHDRTTDKLGVAHQIELSGISYRYPGAARDSLRDVSLTLPVNSSTGIVGSTGAGKTTLVDIVLGLLRPTEGALLVDGTPVGDDNIRAWQRSIGYVPQSIYLTDDTLAANIAFGVPPDQIDHARVAEVGALALVDEYLDRLPDGYQTRVGEAGVRLSGGQRQRIGIARALYRDPDVIVFDEAMSALDLVTERAVMDAVNALQGQKTIVIITHRLASIATCDRIYLLDDGRIEAEGDYDDLRGQSARFRALSEAAE